MTELQLHTLDVALGRITRSNEFPSWEYVDGLDVSAWEWAHAHLRERKYFHSGCSVVVNTDLSPAYVHIKDHATLNAKYHAPHQRDDGLKNLSKGFLRSEDKLRVTCEVRITGNNEFVEYRWYPRFFAERYFYDVFCIMNLAVPGSCDFLNIRFIENGKKESNRLKLSSYNLEESLYLKLEEKIPYARVLDIAMVCDWYDKLDLGVKQKANSQTEKALFSLLHLCKLDGDLASTIWIFHALEAIYSTRVGEGFTNLFNRISFLLDLDVSEKSRMKKNLRKLYDHRSSIVHGGYQVHFPTSWDPVDPSVDEDIMENYRLVQFGINLILASIQALIAKDWYGVEIEERMREKKWP